SVSDHRIIKVVSGSVVQSRAWLLDVAAKSEKKLTSEPYSVSDLAWKADGNGLVVLGTDKYHPEVFNERVYSVSLNDGSFTELANPKGPVGQVDVSPDGKWASYLGPHVDGPQPYDVYVVPTAGGEAKNLTGTVD